MLSYFPPRQHPKCLARYPLLAWATAAVIACAKRG